MVNGTMYYDYCIIVRYKMYIVQSNKGFLRGGDILHHETRERILVTSRFFVLIKVLRIDVIKGKKNNAMGV